MFLFPLPRFSSCLPFLRFSRSGYSSKISQNNTSTSRRFETGKKDVSSCFGIQWMKAKIQSLRKPREEQSLFKTKLNNWVQNAPWHLRRDYQKVAAKVEKCFEQKTPVLHIDDSKCTDLPPIPDHVRDLTLSNLSVLLTLSDLSPHQQLESLKVFNCPELRRILSNLSQLKSLEVLDCPNILEYSALPPQLQKLAIHNASYATPLANLVEVILQRPCDAPCLTIDIDDGFKVRLLGNLLSKALERSPDEKLPHVRLRAMSFDSKGKNIHETFTEMGGEKLMMYEKGSGERSIMYAIGSNERLI